MHNDLAIKLNENEEASWGKDSFPSTEGSGVKT